MKELKELEYQAAFDVKPEVLAAALMAQDRGLEIEHLVLAPLGPSKRRSGNEVQQLSKRFFPDMEVWQIGMARKGLFDGLPIDLFIRTDEEYPSPLEKSRALDRQIADARRFFRPFDQVLHWPRIEMEQLEAMLSDRFPSFLHEIWGLDSYGDLLDERQRFLLCYVLPMAGRIAGDWELTSRCLSAVIGKEVTLDFGPSRTYAMPISETSELWLGETIALGEEFHDDLPILRVHIHQVSNEELDKLLDPEGMQRVLHELLYAYLIPLEVSVDTCIHIHEPEQMVGLGQSSLGYGTVLQTD